MDGLRSPPAKKQKTEPQADAAAKQKFKEDEEVYVQIPGWNGWVKGYVAIIGKGGKFLIRLCRHVDDEVARIINSKWVRAVSIDNIRKSFTAAREITIESNVEQGLIDFYLNGRPTKNLQLLSKSILKSHNKQIRLDFPRQMSLFRKRRYMKFMESRMISMEVLDYCLEPAYKTRVYCLWCEQSGVKMTRGRVRSNLFSLGTSTDERFGYDLSVFGNCDSCNFALDNSDYAFQCETKEHDVWMECLWKVKKEHVALSQQVRVSAAYLDHYSVQCIADYAVGDIRQFAVISQD